MKSIAVTMKKLPPHLVAKGKVDILNVVTQLQLSNQTTQTDNDGFFLHPCRIK